MKLTDEELERRWEILGDIPVNDEGDTEEEFETWPEGSDIYDIWGWFDEHHSKGVYYLLYQYQPPNQ